MYTKEHIRLHKREDGTLTVAITEKGDELMGGIQFVDWYPEIQELIVEGTKTVTQVHVPVNGIATFLPPDYARDIAGQIILWFKPGWTFMDDAELLNWNEYKKYCKEL